MNTLADEATGDPELPVRKLLMTVDKGQQQNLFDQLREFADKHGFAVRIASTILSGDDFIAEMWREDFKIFATNPSDSETFEVAVYRNNTGEIPPKYFDRLIADLGRFVSEIPNATFTEKDGDIGLNDRAARMEPQLPLRKIEMTVEKDQNKKLFDQLRKFADNHRFAVRTVSKTKTGDDFLVRMYRKDVKIFAQYSSFISGAFKMGVYKTTTQEIPSTHLDTLISDLESFVSEVPNVTFSEQGD